ncbi:MAG: ABC transporter ATP-binding protein [Bacteroidota bacterium]
MKKNPSNGIARLLQIAGTKKYFLFLSCIFALLHAGLALIPYILVYYIVLQLNQPPADYELIRQYLLWGVGAGIGSYIFFYASGISSHVAAFNILYLLRKQLAVQLGHLPLGVVQSYRSGTLKKIMNDDIERIEGFIAHHIPDFIKGISLPLVTIIYLFYVDWRLAAISFVPLLIIAIWMPLVFSSPYTKEMMKFHHQAQEDMNSGIVEFVRSMPVMKIFAQTADRFKQFSGSVNSYIERSDQWLEKSAPPFAIFMSFMSNASLPVLILGTYLYLNNGVGFATVILFLMLGVGYIKPVFALSNMGMQIMLINRGVQRMDQVLQAEAQEKGKDDTAVLKHDIEFKSVDFAYVNQQKVLEDVSFHVPEGSITAFVGPSGAGKTTAAQLIARFWDIQSGEILIGYWHLQ